MVDSHHVIELEAVPHPADPPVVTRGPMIIPAVQGVAPDLAVGGEGIRRAAGNGGGAIVSVQLEQLRVSPHVRSVGRDVDGNIAYDLDMLTVCVGLQLRPLPVKLELEVLLELDVEVQLPVVVIQGEAPVHPDILRPLAEGHPAEEGFQSHEQGVIVQPPAVFSAESVESLIFPDMAALIGLVQQRQTVLAQRYKVHLGGILAEIHPVALLTGQDALIDEAFQADEIGVTGKGGIGLIGGVIRGSVRGCPQGQNLPVTLTGLFQPVHKVVGRPVKAADAVPGGQAGDGQQNASISIHRIFLLLSVDLVGFQWDFRNWKRFSFPNQYNPFLPVRQSPGTYPEQIDNVHKE